MIKTFMRRALSSVLVGLVLATSVLAHPGHGIEATGEHWQHRAASPYHWFEGLLAVILVLGLGGWLAYRQMIDRQNAGRSDVVRTGSRENTAL